MADADEPPKPDDRGMTVNERLFVAGLLNQFDDAVRAGDRDKLVSLHVMVQIEPEGAEITADKVLSHPNRFGRMNPQR
jgi:hypothetical protein